MGGRRGYRAAAVINVSLKTADYILIDYTLAYSREIKGKSGSSGMERWIRRSRSVNECVCLCVLDN